MTDSPESQQSPIVVPIRSLGPSHRNRIAKHLLALDEHDRYLRFGCMVNDAHLARYPVEFLGSEHVVLAHVVDLVHAGFDGVDRAAVA